MIPLNIRDKVSKFDRGLFKDNKKLVEKGSMDEKSANFATNDVCTTEGHSVASQTHQMELFGKIAAKNFCRNFYLRCLTGL